MIKITISYYIDLNAYQNASESVFSVKGEEILANVIKALLRGK